MQTLILIENQGQLIQHIFLCCFFVHINYRLYLYAHGIITKDYIWSTQESFYMSGCELCFVLCFLIYQQNN